jgi:hypothetical protein
VTFWEVLDDAVKIGLGAAIGLLAARFAHVRDWRKQRKIRRIDTLEAIAKDFEIAHQTLIDLSVDVRTAQVKLQKPPSPKEAGRTVRSQLSSVESRLQILGYAECVGSLKNYSHATSDFTKAMIAEGSGAEDQFTTSKGELYKARAEFYCALRNEYQKSEAA